MIKAQIVADSLSPQGCRLTTMLVTFPRYILAELNTHRMLSKNSASSRAIPFTKMLESVKSNPFIPIAWQKDHKGMQGTEYLNDTEEDNYDVSACITEWLAARDFAVQQAMFLSEIGTTKQLINRLIEPFMWHTVLISGTEWENFFALRCPQYEIPNMSEGEEFYNKTFRSRKDVIKALSESKINNYEGSVEAAKVLTEVEWLETNKGMADIHIMSLAEAIWDAIGENIPKQLSAGEWHIPFGGLIDGEELAGFLVDNCERLNLGSGSVENYKVKIATAMAARTSYTVVGEESKPVNFENDLKLHDRLSTSGHWSPFEHCAQVMSDYEYDHSKITKPVSNPSIEETSLGWCGNFRGFIQYRKMFTNENITE